MASVLITGASKGIGRAIAQEFARRGHRVVATARRPQTLADLDVDQRLALDVTDQESVDAAVKAAGEIDVLVSNAGDIFRAPVEASPQAEIARLFELNTFGAIRVTQALLPQMRERGSGRILFMSSVVSGLVMPGSATYAATKWALEGLAEGLATEVRHWNISVGLLQPGAVSSGALDNVRNYRLPDDPYAPLMKGRENGGSSSDLITPEEVAKATADAAEADVIPLRIPIGANAARVLAARKQSPADQPFVPYELDW